MNISWYDDQTLLGTENNVNNGTYNELFITATSYSTEYILNITANDGNGNWNNQTINFTTKGARSGEIVTHGTPGFEIITLLGSIMIAILLLRKRRRKTS
jgi:hypothetical protein